MKPVTAERLSARMNTALPMLPKPLFTRSTVAAVADDAMPHRAAKINVVFISIPLFVSPSPHKETRAVSLRGQAYPTGFSLQEGRPKSLLFRCLLFARGRYRRACNDLMFSDYTNISTIKLPTMTHSSGAEPR